MKSPTMNHQNATGTFLGVDENKIFERLLALADRLPMQVEPTLDSIISPSQRRTKASIGVSLGPLKKFSRVVDLIEASGRFLGLYGYLRLKNRRQKRLFLLDRHDPFHRFFEKLHFWV